MSQEQAALGSNSDTEALPDIQPSKNDLTSLTCDTVSLKHE
jgi:hypothetical protein